MHIAAWLCEVLVLCADQGEMASALCRVGRVVRTIQLVYGEKLKSLRGMQESWVAVRAICLRGSSKHTPRNAGLMCKMARGGRPEAHVSSATVAQLSVSK